VLRQGQELLAQGVRCLALRSYQMINPQSTQNREKLVRIVQRVAEVLRADIGLYYLRCLIAFRGNQRGSESNQYIHLSLDALTGLRQRLQQRQPCMQVMDG